ncbi:MAG: hypothetical protein EOO67_07635 [Microbacterium sp.]|nr:MAG: hypothetical protein EOO67_07635 [Microbacterium sp.]
MTAGSSPDMHHDENGETDMTTGHDQARDDAGDSLTGNEFDEPGANYPDSAKETAPEARDDAGVGGAVSREEPAEQLTGTQDGPRLEQNVTTDMERLNGIVTQTRADLTGEPADVVEKSLTRRLDDAGITLDDGELQALARDIAEGAAGA